MKALIYTLVILVCFASCKSVDKMVEKGEYDKAFDYAIDKLQGDKHKKTEYVKALEKAYFKLNSASLKEIERMNVSDKPSNWSKVLNIYKTIEHRQNRLDPMIPLVSENGYVASFDMKSYHEEIRVAEDNTCLYYYNNAKSLIEQSEISGDKNLAKKAYGELKMIEKFKSVYKENAKLKEKALELGLTTVYFEIFNDLRGFHGNTIERELLTLPVSHLDDIWFDHSIGSDGGSEPDFVAIIELKDIDFSPERERANTYHESKEILLRKEKVKEKRDSVEVWIEKEVYENAKVSVTEIFREKSAELNGTFKVMNTKTKEIVKVVPINVVQNFKGYGCRYIGDDRALTSESRNRMDAMLENFPPDYAMCDELSSAFKNVVMDEARKINFEQY